MWIKFIPPPGDAARRRKLEQRVERAAARVRRETDPKETTMTGPSVALNGFIVLTCIAVVVIIWVTISDIRKGR